MNSVFADAEIVRFSRHCNICQIFYRIIITIKIKTEINIALKYLTKYILIIKKYVKDINSMLLKFPIIYHSKGSHSVLLLAIEIDLTSWEKLYPISCSRIFLHLHFSYLPTTTCTIPNPRAKLLSFYENLTYFFLPIHAFSLVGFFYSLELYKTVQNRKMW